MTIQLCIGNPELPSGLVERPWILFLKSGTAIRVRTAHECGRKQVTVVQKCGCGQENLSVKGESNCVVGGIWGMPLS